MLLALWFDFWNFADWVTPVVSSYWCAMTGQSGWTAGGYINEI